MKNTLIFLCVEGLGLNSEWKGNCLKLADKPNINHLISGIYPWSTLANDKKVSKINVKKKFDCVSTDIDKNFYQIISGDRDIKTLNEKIQYYVDIKEFANLDIFNNIKNFADKNKSKCVHIFVMLSNNKSHFSIENLKFTINSLVKKGLKPLLHLIADGKEDAQFSFANHLKSINYFLQNRNVKIATIVGRDNALISPGHDYTYNKNIVEYYNTICGVGNNSFKTPMDYANDNLYFKNKDQTIKPAYNKSISKYYIENNDTVLFLDSDRDAFSPLFNLLKSNNKINNVFYASTNPIYGNDVDCLMFQDDLNVEKTITSMASKDNLTSLVLSLSHKKGFINKFYGSNNDPNVVRKIIKTDYKENNINYIFTANKLLIDSALQNVGKYDYIVLHVPTIVEAAYEGDLKLLKFAIENFDKNLGRMLNFIKTSGSVMAFASPYGACEKMLNKKLEIIPYKKNSMTPFVFTNGDLEAKKIKTNFYGLYSTLLVTLGVKELSESVIYNSLIKVTYNKDVIYKKLLDQYDVWKHELIKPLLRDFEENSLSLYADLNKTEDYLFKKQQYIVLKEIIKIHKKMFTTPSARKKIFDKLFDYVKYNGIDFLDFDYNFDKLIMTLFDDEIKLSRQSNFASRYFDNYIWKTQIKRNDKWFTKMKNEIKPILSREISKSHFKKMMVNISATIEPFQYFERLFSLEKQILCSNDAIKISEFYDSIKAEVDVTYSKYFKSKLNTNDDSMMPTLMQEPDEVQFESPDHEKVTMYYETFTEVVSLVNDSKKELSLYNKKFFESKKMFDLPEVEDVFKAEPYLLNPLVRKIVNLYSKLEKSIYLLMKNNVNKLNKEINKYDNKYNKKYKEELNNISYEGEFEEGVDLNSQVYLKNLMSQKVKKAGVFDYETIDVEVPKEDIILDLESVNDSDQTDYKLTELDINIRPEYDMTSLWNKKRIEQYNNIENISEISDEAEKGVFNDRRVRESKSKITNYLDLSKIWGEKQAKNAKII